MSNRRERGLCCSLVLLTAFFCLSIISFIMGDIGKSVFGTIGYAATTIALYYVLGTMLSTKKKILMLMAVEALQIIPYMILIVTWH